MERSAGHIVTVSETQTLDSVAADPQRIIAPDPFTVFENRARRFERLAQQHSLGGWLGFLAGLSAAQQKALRSFPVVALPDSAAMARAREHAMPPLPGQSWPRDAVWRRALREIISALDAGAPPVARAVFEELKALSPESIESLADRVMRMELSGDRVASLPFVAAALQVYWTHMVVSLGADNLQSLDVAGVCPACGFLPVASVVRPGGSRYLHCALCGTEWNLVRVKCAACNGTEGISYRQINGGDGIVRAETCDPCKSYLKIIRRDTDSEADPVADDLATLALDVLVDEAGYHRAGPNLLLALGAV